MEDTNGHFISSVVVVVSCLFIFSNFVQNRQQDLCGNKNLKLEATKYVFERPRKNHLIPIRRSMNFNAGTENKEQSTSLGSNSSSIQFSDYYNLCKHSNTTLVTFSLVFVILYWEKTRKLVSVCETSDNGRWTTILNATIPSSNTTNTFATINFATLHNHSTRYL